jgi:hypothetical protein
MGNQDQNKQDWRDVVGTERLYNRAFEGRDDVILWDVFRVQDGEKLRLIFESINSDWKQGVWMMCDKGIDVNDLHGKSVDIWFDKSPTIVSFVCNTDNGFLSIYNIWDRGLGRNSQSHSSGMLIEDLPNGRRYRCNDIGFDTEFDKLVFMIERTL